MANLDRNMAAKARFMHFRQGKTARDIAFDLDISIGQVNRVLAQALFPPTEERVVVNPEFSPRNTKLTPEQRVEMAYLICYGSTLEGLARIYDVAVSTVQHVKENYTARTNAVTENTKNRGRYAEPGTMTPDLAAEMRYLHHVREMSVGTLAARYMVPYPVAYRAVKGETFPPVPRRYLTTDGTKVDPESPIGMALMLALHGASAQFVADYCNLDLSTAQTYLNVFTSTEPA